MSEPRYYVEGGGDDDFDAPDTWTAWGSEPPDRLYVVAEGPGPPNERGAVFTVSPDPRCAGWTTDNGVDHYGLPLHVAEEIVRRYNR